jgi:hypothetical protein
MMTRNGHQGPTTTRGSPRTHHDDPTMTPHPGGPSTTHAMHHLPPAPEQLLIGWFVGVYHAEEQRRARQTPAPAPTAASACSQGGSGATGLVTPPPPMDTTDNTPPAPASRATARGVECGWEQRCMQPMHHPPPASRATARGVEIGGHHCPLLQHPQPLPRAIACGGEGVPCERWCVAGVFSTGIQWNSWILGSPIGIGGGV